MAQDGSHLVTHSKDGVVKVWRRKLKITELRDSVGLLGNNQRTMAMDDLSQGNSSLVNSSLTEARSRLTKATQEGDRGIATGCIQHSFLGHSRPDCLAITSDNRFLIGTGENNGMGPMA